MSNEDTKYDTAEVCLSGHVTTASEEVLGGLRETYCSKCGAKTIDACLSCNVPIRGYRVTGRARMMSQFHGAPAYCYNCGQAFPWTASRIEAAQELARELPGLSAEEQEVLAGSIESLVRNTPAAPVAANRFRRLVEKAGSGAGELFRTILADVLSEAIKKSLFP